MEVRVRERLVGAMVLVAIVVLLVPAILKGRGSAPVEPPAQPTRRVEVPLVDAAAVPEEQVLVPEPVAGASRPAATKESAAPAAKSPPASTAPPATAPEAPVRAASPPVAQAATQSPAWAVQLGAFSNRQKAEQLVADLRKRRYSAFLLEYRASGQVLYRVRVGPEQDRARAEEIAARLAKDGFQPVVARHP
jgi:DedD protein